ncbi:unnamed protein product [Ilex paraguariensis]|uniref:Vitamin K epoxide reductase domain-containing protein n=1 Tax=Ilex paraguariensis TaxID=185542 RepID=A0ABC8SYI5_9AQUA
MASFVSIPSSTPLLTPTPHLFPRRSISTQTQLKNGWARRLLVLRVKCVPDQSGDTEVEAETASLSTSSSSTLSDISSFNWYAALGGLGFLETTYLTYLKLTNSEAFCPIGGGTCGDVLSSDYAVVFGILFILFVTLSCAIALSLLTFIYLRQ